MNETANKIVDIIKDYRSDTGVKIDTNHVIKWAAQFDEDAEFIMEELLHILPTSYLSKDRVKYTLSRMFDRLSTDFKYDNVPDFLLRTKFLDCQGEFKSQSILLDFINQIITEKYDLEISDCGKKDCRHWLYIDDVLASGGTFRKNIIDVINAYNAKKFANSSIDIIGIFLILHEWGYKNTQYSVSQELGIKRNSWLKAYRIYEIDNDPRINYYNPSPKFNHVYPINNSDDAVNNYLEGLTATKNDTYAFRNSKYPAKEEFYSSAENRNRYEQILLNKGLEIINNIADLRAKGLRPLGMTNPNYRTLGTGSHAFTWRNISNTCPLVFWWEVNDWHPLFPVINRGKY